MSCRKHCFILVITSQLGKYVLGCTCLYFVHNFKYVPKLNFYYLQAKSNQVFRDFNSRLFDEFVCKLGLFWHAWAILKREWNERLKAHKCQKRPNLHTNELNTTFFCLTSPLKAPICLKPLKLAWRFVLTSCDIYQNPFT
jgi:hypothetical protein